VRLLAAFIPGIDLADPSSWGGRQIKKPSGKKLAAVEEMGEAIGRMTGVPPYRYTNLEESWIKFIGAVLRTLGLDKEDGPQIRTGENNRERTYVLAEEGLDYMRSASASRIKAAQKKALEIAQQGIELYIDESLDTLFEPMPQEETEAVQPVGPSHEELRKLSDLMDQMLG
jgi:hypothetical protein